jgi:hypothetical protein
MLLSAFVRPRITAALFEHGMSMAFVLCSGADSALLKTRRLILEAAGHKVVVVRDEPSLMAACKEHAFDVAVIGQTVTARMKRRISSLIREGCPRAKVLELYDLHLGRVLDDADSWLMTPAEVPKDLPDHVEELAKRKRQEEGISSQI